MALRLTDENVLFWVTSCEDCDVEENSVTLWGRPFTWDLGLGSSRPDETAKRSFHGRVALIGEHKIILPEVDIHLVHCARRGFAWILRTANCETIPKPPFVVTDSTETERIFNGSIHVELTPNYVENVKEDDQMQYVVRAADWYGVIDQFDLVSGTANLIAFSDSIERWPSDVDCQIVNMEAEGPVADIGIVKWSDNGSSRCVSCRSDSGTLIERYGALETWRCQSCGDETTIHFNSSIWPPGTSRLEEIFKLIVYWTRKPNVQQIDEIRRLFPNNIALSHTSLIKKILDKERFELGEFTESEIQKYEPQLHQMGLHVERVLARS